MVANLTQQDAGDDVLASEVIRRTRVACLTYIGMEEKIHISFYLSIYILMTAPSISFFIFSLF